MGRSAADRREDLVALYKEARGCTRCPLHQTRTQVVFGAGNADADLMFVGEAPGFHEDQQGIPFVGRAGQLLNELLQEQGMDRDDVFIANVLKSRPPDNRDPQPAEIEACRPYLERQVELIEPRVICTLGNFATKLLTGSPQGITRVHGEPQERGWARAPCSCSRSSTRRRGCGRRASSSCCARTSPGCRRCWPSRWSRSPRRKRAMLMTTTVRPAGPDGAVRLAGADLSVT